MTTTSSVLDRALGIAGVVGGLALLAAYVVEVPPGLYLPRLILFFGGSAAVTVALARRAGSVDRRIVVTAVAVALNVASIVMLWLSIGRERPFGGDFGLLWFWIAFATWIADSAVGLLAWRQRTTMTIGALALAVGSVLAILGMDRLGLTSTTDWSVFGRLALLGVALNGIAWVLIGLDLVAGRRARSAAIEASPGRSGPGPGSGPCAGTRSASGRR